MQKSMKVEMPKTPNFIRVGKDTLAIEKFTVEELKQIGAEWTKTLIDKKLNPANYGNLKTINID